MSAPASMDIPEDERMFAAEMLAGAAAGEKEDVETVFNEAGISELLLSNVLKRFTAVDFSEPEAAPAKVPAAAPKPARKPSSVPKKSKEQLAAEAAAAERLKVEAAQRREAAERMQRAQAERRRASLGAVEWLLEHSAKDEEELRACATQFLTGPEFADATEERALSGMCGNPLCAGAVQPPTSAQSRMRVSLSTKSIYRSTPSFFCGRLCAAKAAHLQAALPAELGLLPPQPPPAPPAPAAPPAPPLKKGFFGPAPTPAPPPPPPPPTLQEGPPPDTLGEAGHVTVKGRVVERDTSAPPALPQPPVGRSLRSRAMAVDGYTPRQPAAAPPPPPVPAPPPPPARLSPRHVSWEDEAGLSGDSEFEDEPMDEEESEEEPELGSLPPPAGLRPLGGPRPPIAASLAAAPPARLTASDYQRKLDLAQTAAEERARSVAAAAAAEGPAAGAGGEKGATFYFETFGEGAFGCGSNYPRDGAGAGGGERGGEDGEMFGGGPTHMSAHSYGTLTCVRDDDFVEEERGSEEDEDEDEDEGEGEAGAEMDRDELSGALLEPPSERGPEMRAHLSPFLELWTTLDGWLTPAALAMLQPQRALASEPLMSADEALLAARRAPPLAVDDAEGARRAVASNLAASLGRLAPRLSLPPLLGAQSTVPALERLLDELIRCFVYRCAAPALALPRWDAMLLLLLTGLAAQRAPELRACLLGEAAVAAAAAVRWEAGVGDEHWRLLFELLIPA